MTRAGDTASRMAATTSVRADRVVVTGRGVSP